MRIWPWLLGLIASLVAVGIAFFRIANGTATVVIWLEAIVMPFCATGCLYFLVEEIRGR